VWTADYSTCLSSVGQLGWLQRLVWPQCWPSVVVVVVGIIVTVIVIIKTQTIIF